MNTRLQVEHPVTELITGIDLVEQMIRVAAGEPLTMTQSDVQLKGWAVESRVYAEDPTRNFLPSTGRLVKYRPPVEGRNNGITVRNDTGVFEGGEISIYYDPMIAKLVTHAGDRITAIEAQANALDEFVIDGIRHNIPFLSSLMQHPRWRSGNISTAFIAEEYPEGFKPLKAAGDVALRMAAVAAFVDNLGNDRKRQISGQMKVYKPVVFEDKRSVLLDKTRYDVHVDSGDGACWSASTMSASRIASNPTGAPACRCGSASSTAKRSPCRCAPFSTAMRFPMPASLSRPASSPAARPSFSR